MRKSLLKRFGEFISFKRRKGLPSPCEVETQAGGVDVAVEWIEAENIPPEMLQAATPLTSLNFQLTSRCNLRCEYCPQGLEQSAVDMSPALIDTLTNHIASEGIRSVMLGFYGETLCFAGWEACARHLADEGIELAITTKLAPKLTPEEVEALSRFQIIFVSLDTVDIELLRRIRKPADVRTLLMNMHLIRSRALRLGGRAPAFAWSCTLSDRIIPTLTDLVGFAASFGVNYIFINDLMHYDGMPAGARNLFELSGSEFLRYAEQLAQALDFARSLKITLNVPWEERFLARLVDARAECNPEGNQHSGDSGRSVYEILPMKNIQGRGYYYSQPVPKGKTRMCLDPWTTLFVMPDGTLYTCCARGEVMGTLACGDSVRQALASQAFVDLRRQLLRGEIADETCRNCCVRPLVSPAELGQAVSDATRRKPVNAPPEVRDA